MTIIISKKVEVAWSYKRLNSRPENVDESQNNLVTLEPRKINFKKFLSILQQNNHVSSDLRVFKVQTICQISA